MAANSYGVTCRSTSTFVVKAAIWNDLFTKKCVAPWPHRAFRHSADAGGRAITAVPSASEDVPANLHTSWRRVSERACLYELLSGVAMPFASVIGPVPAATGWGHEHRSSTSHGGTCR